MLVGKTYSCTSGKIHNLRTDNFVKNHGDVTGLEVGADVLDNTQFRRDAFGVTPYLVVSLPEKRRTASLGIAEVIVGPSSNAQAIVASIELLRYTLSRVVT